MLDIDDQIRRYVEAIAPAVRSYEIWTEPKNVKRLKPALVGALLVLIGVGAVFLPPMLRPSPVSVFMSAPSDANRGDVVIFLTDDVTTGQRETIERKLGALPGVGSFRFMDRDAVYAEFRTTFKDQPSIVENVDPDSLPQSYRVDLTDLRDGGAVVAAVDHLPGVRKVVHAGFGQ